MKKNISPKDSSTKAPLLDPKRPRAIVFAAILLFTFNFSCGYPGIWFWDTNEQYTQAVTGQFNDWHPPIMAVLWSGLRWISDGGAPLFFLHIFFYWLALGLIAVRLQTLDSIKRAWAVIAVGIWPTFLMLNVDLLKDVGLAVAFLTSFAIVFWYRAEKRIVPPSAMFLAASFLFYGVLVRANGIFGGAPILIYLANPQLFRKPVLLFPALLLIVAMVLPASSFVNHKIIHAQSLQPHRSLQIFDLAGIAHFAKDPKVFEPASFTQSLIDACYDPSMWDTLSSLGKCRVFAQTGFPQETKMWLLAIARHPFPYLEHRLAHFNSELDFVEPRHHTDARVKESEKHGQPLKVQPLTAYEAAVDFLEFNPLTAPVFAFVLGLIMLAEKYLKNPLSIDSSVSCLLLSGLFYSGGYLVVGVASDYRYQFWAMLSIFLAFVTSWSWCPTPSRSAGLKRSEWVYIGVLGLTATMIVFSQVLEGDALFPEHVIY